MVKPLYQSDISSLSLIHRGKVRDIYDLDDAHMLIVTTDRISAFDVIMPDPVPGKGELLTRISNFWFEKFKDLIPNQLTNRSTDDLPITPQEKALLRNRSIIVKKLKALPVEAIVRGYLIGSGWKEYQATGSVCNIHLPAGIPLAGKLPHTLFTPSTKAELGHHDENISVDQLAQITGKELAQQIEAISIRMYTIAAQFAYEKGIIIADTKFEFGLDAAGQLTLIDEVLTPDSSRFWPVDSYQPGSSPISFDKQYIRDYLETLTWNKQAPGPHLPPDVIENTRKKYEEAVNRLLEN